MRGDFAFQVAVGEHATIRSRLGTSPLMILMLTACLLAVARLAFFPGVVFLLVPSFDYEIDAISMR